MDDTLCRQFFVDPTRPCHRRYTAATQVFPVSTRAQLGALDPARGAFASRKVLSPDAGVPCFLSNRDYWAAFPTPTTIVDASGVKRNRSVISVLICT
jgi:hypothetical protein